MPSSYSRLRLVLGDQLNERHSWFREVRPDTLYVLMECRSETGYVRHHVQKVVGFFLAMRNFADVLLSGGHQVLYLTLDDPRNRQGVAANLEYLAGYYDVQALEYQLPDEYRLDQELLQLAGRLGIPVKAVDTEHFLTSREEVARMFAGKKQFLLETFYRRIRQRYRILMEPDGKTPLTGRWNYDAENRKKLPAHQAIPPRVTFRRDVTDLTELLHRMDLSTIGTIDPGAFPWPVTRGEALQVLDDFVAHRLVRFGTFQDAMTDRDPVLFHSFLSFVLNIKLIHPLEVVERVLKYWEIHRESIGIAQVEGFIRQVIGWREYMRGIYWAKMPAFAQLNFFAHRRPLPEWYWTGATRMKCLQHSIGQSLEHAYAHHIQRLMVTGNFALLAGVHPDEVDQWYLGIYMDALEWVEITNTRGMSQYADGGIVGTKPYVSSANYLNKMSDYCRKCPYDPTLKYGPRACPFNSLYWDFYDRHRDKLAANPRIGMMYRVWDRMAPAEKEKILEQAQTYLQQIDAL